MSSRAARKPFGVLLACAAVGGGAYLGTLSGQNPAPAVSAAALDEFRQKVLPILSDVCMTCHNDLESAGDLSMETFVDPKVAAAKPDLWARVLDKLSEGEMPPASMPPLAPADVAAVTGWIERTYGLSVAHRDPSTADPGRVTTRRLTRREYNNTIRDLLGVTVTPADEFPVDDAGYGFDNIGDVLTISPMLMEKYMRAARRVSRAAVFGESYPAKPTLLVKLQPKKDQDNEPAASPVTPFSVRGALFGASFHVPVEGEYEFRWRYGNTRTANDPRPDMIVSGRPGVAGRGRLAAPTSLDTPATLDTPTAAPRAGRVGGAPGAGRGRGRAELTEEDKKAREEQLRKAAPPEPMIFTIDGQKVYEFVVEGTIDYAYTRGEQVTRAKLGAGDHALRISWPGLTRFVDPMALISSDGRRKLFVDYLDIHGPFSPSKAPPASFKQIFICGAPGKYTSACAQRIVENLARRAYRRPPTPQELQRLMALVRRVQKEDAFEESIRVAIEAMLMSPNFLFRTERDPETATGGAARPVPPVDTAYRISDYELASRLSYFLWSSMPDDALFELAAKNGLRDQAVLDAQVRRMLADPKAVSLVENFGEQWLNLRVMDSVKPDAATFRTVDDELLQDMRTETRMFLAAIIREDRSILDLIDGRFTFVNGPLARYYGIPGVEGEQFQRVELDGEQRGGLVTQGSILTISSYATRTSPVLRGKWVLDNFLGAAPPPPPPDIPALTTADLGTAASLRQRLEQHRKDPSCGACHNQMDPIGFALENYDAAGAWRTKDGAFDIDSTGTLPDGRVLAGSKGLKAALRSLSAAFAGHVADRLMTYALGRGLERADRPFVKHVAREVSEKEYRFSALVTAIVHSRPFQMRSRGTP